MYNSEDSICNIRGVAFLGVWVCLLKCVYVWDGGGGFTSNMVVRVCVAGGESFWTKCRKYREMFYYFFTVKIQYFQYSYSIENARRHWKIAGRQNLCDIKI